ETIDIATQALGLIEVEYDVLPAALTPREAMKPDAPRVPVLDVERPREGNVQQPVYVRQRGDVDRGLAEADLVSESHFSLPTQYHVDSQTRCCIAEWDGQRLTVTRPPRACGTSSASWRSPWDSRKPRCAWWCRPWAGASAPRRAPSAW